MFDHISTWPQNLKHIHSYSNVLFGVPKDLILFHIVDQIFIFGQFGLGEKNLNFIAQIWVNFTPPRYSMVWRFFYQFWELYLPQESNKKKKKVRLVLYSLYQILGPNCLVDFFFAWLCKKNVWHWIRSWFLITMDFYLISQCL